MKSLGPHVADWPRYVTSVAERLADQLGVAPDCKVQAQLYKLLMYEKGDHFNTHRDSEKEDGMFATMVLLLPSTYTVRPYQPSVLLCGCLLLLDLSAARSHWSMVQEH